MQEVPSSASKSDEPTYSKTNDSESVACANETDGTEIHMLVAEVLGSKVRPRKTADSLMRKRKELKS